MSICVLSVGNVSNKPVIDATRCVKNYAVGDVTVFWSTGDFYANVSTTSKKDACDAIDATSKANDPVKPETRYLWHAVIEDKAQTYYCVKLNPTDTAIDTHDFSAAKADVSTLSKNLGALVERVIIDPGHPKSYFAAEAADAVAALAALAAAVTSLVAVNRLLKLSSTLSKPVSKAVSK